MSRDDVFHLSVSLRTDGRNQPRERFSLTLHKLFDSDRFDNDRLTLAVWGTPAVDGKILGAAELARRLDAGGVGKLASTLDSVFLIVVYEHASGTLSLANDRLGALPFFFGTFDGAFHASSGFKRLFDRRGAAAGKGFDPWAIGEFLYFRRMIGTRTYDRDITLLPGASILTVDASGAIVHKRYWRITPGKLTGSLDEQADRLAAAFKDAMAMAMSDGHRCALLLSGGLDSRALLAAAPQPPLCITTTPKPNNELAVARELAATRGAQHVYIPRPEQLLNNALVPAVALGGGMTVFNEAQFIDYGSAITPLADTVFIGLGPDFMFGGNYLPKSIVKFAGRPGWHYGLHALSDDLPRQFVDSISYRLKTSDPMRVIRADKREELRGRLIDAVRAVMDEGRALGLEGYDLWEFVHVQNLARHYSFLMAQSIRTFAACRIPALSNALYELSWAIRAEDKANWTVFQKAIVRMNPELMAVRNANTNIRADMPLARQSLVKFARALAQRAGLAASRAPSWWDRSWPQPRQAVDVNPMIAARVTTLPASDAIAATGLLDPSAIETVIADHRSGAHDHSVLLNELITIDAALTPLG